VEKGQMARPMIRIQLKYGARGENVISGIQRVSRPGRRVYFGRDNVPPVLAGLGTSILTTSRGVMTGRQATAAGVGGEVLCNVW
jgi:small subunit ribosomal protein S8